MKDTIGQRLKQAREYRHLTLESAAHATRIRLHYLQALELDDYSGMVSAAQARGFLRNYGEFLGVNIDQLLAELQSVQAPAPAQISGPLPQVDVTSAAPAPQSTSNDRSRPFRMLRFPSVKGPRLAHRPKEESTAMVESHKAAQAEPSADSQGTELVESSKPVLKTKGARRVVKPQVETLAKDEAELELPESVQAETMHGSEDVHDPLSGVEQIKVEAENQPLGNKQTKEARPGILEWLKSIFKLRVITSSDVQNLDGDVSPESELPTAGSQAKVISPPPNKSAEEIFAEIGLQLRRQRELLSLRLDEIERHIRVRVVYLRALEEGAFDKLPSPVQTRGMLANYATFLDLDTEALMLRFADVLQARHRQRYPEKVRARSSMQASPSMPPWRSFIAGDLLFGIGIVAILVGLAIWGVGRLLTPLPEQESIQSTAPSISDVLAGTAEASFPQEVTLIPAQDTPLSATDGAPESALETPTFSGIVNVQVNIVAVERAFMLVKVDGEEAFNGRVLPGTAYPFEAEDQIEVLTGNAAALRITFNGRDLGLMGNLGEVVNRIYTLQGIATGTPTLSPTPTLTPQVTATPTPTNTPTPTLLPETAAP